MVSWFNLINNNTQIKCSVKGDKYTYIIRERADDDSEYKSYSIGKSIKSPVEISKRSDIGKSIVKKFESKLTMEQAKSLDMYYGSLMDKLEHDTTLQFKEVMDLEKEESKAKEEQLEMFYSRFKSNCEKYNFTPLQYIVRVFEGLGVSSELEMTKAYCGYLQTYLGLKGTNVIGVGEQSSGKTHCVEKPFDCIESDYVHLGTFSKASFFRKYGGMDLTGHIFYLGDLGGVNDDSNTIDARDLLKQLTTDGVVSREVVNEDNKKEVLQDKVIGYPALVYTTVSEEMINEQEKSRSVILSPPEVDQERMMIYDAFQESAGVQNELKNRIEKDKFSIQGFSWWLKKEIGDIEMFNPYMFFVQRYLGNMNDFNRKIKEFNMLLKIICILNKGHSITHNLYSDFDSDNPDDWEIETRLYLPSKQDVIDALTLFEGSTGLLPSEIAMTKSILEDYSEFPKELWDDEKTEDNDSFEEIVRKSMTQQEIAIVNDEGFEFIEDYEKPYKLTDQSLVYCFFTIEDLKRKHRSKRWYRDFTSRNVKLSDKLYKLYNYGILIRLGKDKTGKVVYGLGQDIDALVNEIEPSLTAKDAEKARKLFAKYYPDFIDEYDSFVSKQNSLKTKKTNFEINKDHLYDLDW